jgi:hypothetical protein
MLEALRTLAQIATPIVAAVAVFVAWVQLRRNRTNQRETTAKGIWREYLRLALEYPEFARGNFQTSDKPRYEWFVNYLLWGSEEILEFDPTWEANVRANLGYHHRFFQDDTNFRNTDLILYSQKIQKLVAEVTREGMP